MPEPEQTQTETPFQAEALSLCHKIVVSMDTACLPRLHMLGVLALSCKSRTGSNEQEIELGFIYFFTPHFL